MLRGQTNGSVSVLLYLISFYFDRLKYFCESKPDRDKKWQKAIVVPYLDATMIPRSFKYFRNFCSSLLKSLVFSSG